VFFLKKEPKNFRLLANASGSVRDRTDKSLLLLFFRKEDFLLPNDGVLG
jgi:hypothetical protein